MKRISIVQVRPLVIDEWFGISVDFTFVEGVRVPAGECLDVGGGAATAFRRAVSQEILSSEELKAFFAKPTTVTVHADGESYKVTLSRPREVEDFQSVEFFAGGGTAISTRR